MLEAILITASVRMDIISQDLSAYSVVACVKHAIAKAVLNVLRIQMEM
jgi:hypothetical protein